MNQKLFIALVSLAVSALTAQGPPVNPNGSTLRIASQPALAFTSSNWVSVSGYDTSFAALQYDQTRPDTRTLLLTHTSVETGPNAPAITQGLLQMYPFLGPPKADWNASNAAFTALLNSNAIVFPESTATALAIPPGRVAAHISAFLSAPEQNGGQFGPNLADTTPIDYLCPDWPLSLTNDDARSALIGPWSTPRLVMDVTQVGRRGVVVAAYCATGAEELEGIEDLNAMLDDEFGFLIYMQLVHIKRIANAADEVRCSQVVVAKRQTLKVQNNDPWRTQVGPFAPAPSIFDKDGYRVHICSGELHVQLLQGPNDPYVADLRACIPVSTGGYAVAERIPNPNGIRNDMARFGLPVNATTGLTYFFRQSAPDLPVTTNFAYAGGPGTMILVVLPPPQ